MVSVHLLDRTSRIPRQPGVLDALLRAAGIGRGTPRIRCPCCRWRPRRDSRWICNRPGCGHRWNTFDTRGRCPGCGHQWTITQCLVCRQISPHEAWYEKSGDEAD